MTKGFHKELQVVGGQPTPTGRRGNKWNSVEQHKIKRRQKEKSTSSARRSEPFISSYSQPTHGKSQQGKWVVSNWSKNLLLCAGQGYGFLRRVHHTSVSHVMSQNVLQNLYQTIPYRSACRITSDELHVYSMLHWFRWLLDCTIV